MSYCINPQCSQPTHPLNAKRLRCQSCGSSLSVKPGWRAVRLLQEDDFSKLYELQNLWGEAEVLQVLSLNHPRAIALLQHQGKVLAQLKHPGTPQVAADGYFIFPLEDGSEPLHCLAMEKLEGMTLETWQRSQDDLPIPEALALNWLRQLAEILARLHQHSCFHRDLQPANILLKEDGELALINFASVREVAIAYVAFAQRSVTGEIQETETPPLISPGYTPWEQAQGRSVPQSDFFALGRTFVSLLTGKSPRDFPEDPRTGALMWQHRASQYSRSLVALIDAFMDPQVSQRPPKAEAILQHLNEIEGNSFPFQAPWTATEDAFLNPQEPPRDRRFSQVAVKLAKPLLWGICFFLLGTAARQIYLERPSLLQDVLSPFGGESQNSDLSPSPSPQLRVLPGDNTIPILSLSHPSKGQIQGVNAVAFSPSQPLLVSAAQDGSLAIWDSRTGQLQRAFPAHSQRIDAIAFSPDGKLLATGSADRTIKVWSTQTWALRRSLPGHSSWVFALAFSPDGQTLASGSGDNTIKLWSVRRGQLLHTLSGHSGWVVALVFSPDGQTLISGSFDRQIQLWHWRTGRTIRRIDGGSHPVLALGISPDGQTLLSPKGNGRIQLWNLNTGQPQMTLSGHRDRVRALAVSPDGSTLASGSGDRENSIKLWALDRGYRKLTLPGHGDRVRALAFRSDGKLLASGSSDNTIKLWPVRSGNEE